MQGYLDFLPGRTCYFSAKSVLRKRERGGRGGGGEGGREGEGERLQYCIAGTGMQGYLGFLPGRTCYFSAKSALRKREGRRRGGREGGEGGREGGRERLQYCIAGVGMQGYL